MYGIISRRLEENLMAKGIDIFEARNHVGRWMNGFINRAVAAIEEEFADDIEELIKDKEARG